MPDWGHGKYGMSGGEAIRRALDDMAGGIRSGVESKRGFDARLHYLKERKGGADALQRAGVSKETLRRWNKGTQQPSAANRRKVDQAYRELRGKNVAAQLKRRLSKNGRGTRVSVEPLPPGALPANQRTRQAQFDDREMTVRPSDWNQAVDAWARGDLGALEDWWMDRAGDLGSPPEAWFEVAHVGFAA